MIHIATHYLGTLKAPGVTLAFPLGPHVFRAAAPLTLVAQGAAEDLVWVAEVSEDGINWTAGSDANTASGTDIMQRVPLSNPRDWLRIRALDGTEVNMSFSLEA